MLLRNGRANWMYIWLQLWNHVCMWARPGRKQEECKQTISLAGELTRDCSLSLSYTYRVVCTVLKGLCSPLGDHFQDCEPPPPPGRHGNSNQDGRSWLQLTAGLSWAPGSAGGNSLIQPEPGCLHACSQTERCCRNSTMGEYLCLHARLFIAV